MLPTTTNITEEVAARGTGEVKRSSDYLKLDSTSYYYNKFKATNNEFLDDAMWSQAALNGESESLAYYLDNIDSTASSKYSDLLNTSYDNYMMIVSLGSQDDTTSVERYDSDGNSIGNYTDKAFYEAILDYQLRVQEAEILEEEKSTLNFFQKAGAWFASTGATASAGLLDFANDIYNVGESIVNIFANFSGDENVGDRFLYAWTDDDAELGGLADYLRWVAYDFDLNYLSIHADAVAAVEEGYVAPTVDNSWSNITSGAFSAANTGVGAGRTTWGTWWNAGIESITYMAPSMALNALLVSSGVGAPAAIANAISSATFYTGIMSGFIGESVSNAALNGISYKDLNAGTVVANAATKAAVQFAIEKALGYLIGFSGLDKIVGTGTAKATTKVSTTLSKTATTTASQWAKLGLTTAGDMVKEGLEEVFQELSDSLINSAFGGDYAEYGITSITWEDIRDSFIVGALVSGGMSAVTNASVVLPSNRAQGLAADGSSYQMGIAETLNFTQAMSELNSLNQQLNSDKTSVQKKADAAFKISSLFNSVGSVLKSMGVERAMKVNSILQAELKVKAKKAAAKTQMSDTAYASNLVSELLQAQEQAYADYVPVSLVQKLKNAVAKIAGKLKTNEVTEFDSIITDQIDPNDPNIPLDSSSTKDLKAALSNLGAEAIVGTDGNLITESEGVIFANSQLVEDGNLQDIIRGVAYDRVQSTVLKSLTKKQKDLILGQFQQTTGTEGTIDDAVTALLFDKTFYTNILLSAQSLNYSSDEFKMLTTLDRVVIKGITAVDKATKLLLQKVTETLRSGILTVATENRRIDLGAISGSVINSSLKAEILQNRNVIFSKTVDQEAKRLADKEPNSIIASEPKGKKTSTTKDVTRAVWYDMNIDKFAKGLSETIRKELKSAARSTNSVTRLDAYIVLVYYTKISNLAKGNEKLVYLPADPVNTVDRVYVESVELTMGDTLTNILDGKYEVGSLKPEFVDYLQANGFILTERNDRIAAVRSLLFEQSKGSLTISTDGVIIKVLDRFQALKEEFRTDTSIREKLKSERTIDLQEIWQGELPASMKGLQIKYDPRLISAGMYIDGQNVITLNGNTIVKTLLHELTHVCQYLTRGKTNYVGGGDIAQFTSLPRDTRESISKYIDTNLPLTSLLVMKDQKNQRVNMMYFSLSGELEANASVSNMTFDVGFTWEQNKTILVAPDGKTKWSMQSGVGKKGAISKPKSVKASGQAKPQAKASGQAKPQPTAQQPTQSDINSDTNITLVDGTTLELQDIDAGSLDMPISKIGQGKLKDDPLIQNFMANGFLKLPDGTPRVWYRGTENANDFGNLERTDISRSLGEFYTLSYDVAKGYSYNDFTRGYISNVTRQNTLVVDAKGADWSNLDSALPDATKQTFFNIINGYSDVLKAMIPYIDYDTNLLEQKTKTALKDPSILESALRRLKTRYGFTKTKALKVLASMSSFSEFKHLTTDSMILLGTLAGKEAVVIANVNEDGIRSTDLVLMAKGHLKRVTVGSPDVNLDASEIYAKPKKSTNQESTGVSENFEAEIEKKRAERNRKYHLDRYISNKRASQSNLKYYIQPGNQIRLDPALADFVESTTANFDKLPAILQKKIKAGTLTKQGLIYYAASTSKMNNFTYQAIAKYVFQNDAAASINYAEMVKLLTDIEKLATVSYLVEDSTKTPKEFIKQADEIVESVGNDLDAGKKYLKASQQAQRIKVKGKWQEVHADPKQLTTVFLRYYDGTNSSLRVVNTIGKTIDSNQRHVTLIENVDSAESSGKVKKGAKDKVTVWNWISRMVKADVDYDVTDSADVSESIDELDRVDKINAIERFLLDRIYSQISQLPKEQQKAAYAKAMQKHASNQSQLDNLSDKKIDQLYLKMTMQEQTGKVFTGEKSFDIDKRDRKIDPQKAARKSLETRVKSVGKKITARIANLKTRYNNLNPTVQALFDPENNYKFTQDYSGFSDAELQNALDLLKLESKKLGAAQSEKALEVRMLRREIARLERVQKQATRDLSKSEKEKKTLTEKVERAYRTKFKEQTFEFISPVESNKLVKIILNSQWGSKTRMSTVQELTNNSEQNVLQAKTFFDQHATALLGATNSEINEAVEWFLTTKMNNVGEEYRTFSAIKMFFLGHVFTESSADKNLYVLEEGVRDRIENYLKSDVSLGGTLISVWKTVRKQISPFDSAKNMDMTIDGVVVTEQEKDDLFTAAEDGRIDDLVAIQDAIIKRISAQKTSKQSLLRKITTIRSMAMLSSPITWLRNITSNIALKNLYSVSEKIGNAIWKGKTVSGQITMKGKVTPEIQSFIETHYLDNGLFDQIVSNLSKYSPSDIIAKNKILGGSASKNELFINMVVKSMYNKYYNENLFKNQFANDVHKKLMKALSDNSYVRKSAIRYFGKMLAEQGHDFSQLTSPTDEIMVTFAQSVGQAMSDYMHSDNMFNKFETLLANNAGEAWLFAYKTLLPFASSSWQWAKAALKLSPLGLGRAIYRMATLETQIIKAEKAWSEGKSQTASEMVEYLARRDLGQGVIGTISYFCGLMLAGLGYIDLEDDDYGTPKLRIGNIEIDVSSIFGTSSLLAGAALITGIKSEEDGLDGWLEGMNRMADVFVSDIPIMSIIEMDMYSSGTWSTAMDQLESIALSYIPNIIKWIAGGTYTGTLRKENFWETAAAYIPFLGSIVNEKVIDPYTGESGSAWEIFNRVVPFFSVDVASEIEEQSVALGLNKSELSGTYTINDEAFTVTGSELTTINQAYGEWNASDLALFYNNAKSMTILVDGTYKTLTYNQMTDEQRARAVQNIMSTNAGYAKILAWTSAGNKYYTSSSEYLILKQLGITNVYIGTAGFAS